MTNKKVPKKDGSPCMIHFAVNTRTMLGLPVHAIQSPEELDMPKRTKADMLGLMEWIEDILYTIATIVACSDSVVFFCLEPSLVKLLGLSCRRSAVMIGESNGFACFARTGHRHEHVRFNSTVSTWRQPALFHMLAEVLF